MRRKHLIRFAFLTLATIAYVSTRQALADMQPTMTLSERNPASFTKPASATADWVAHTAAADSAKEQARWERQVSAAFFVP